MAEGLVGGVLGEDDDKPAAEAQEAPVSAEAFAAAVVAIASRQDPQVARDTSAFLRDQSELLKVQKQHLEAEHAARLHFLRGQAREVDIRRFGLRLRIGFQLFLVLVATVIGLGGVLLIHDAFTSQRVVIEPFDAPSALASRALKPERSPESAARKSLIEMLPSTRWPRQSNCPVAANEREIDGQASDRSISSSASLT